MARIRKQYGPKRKDSHLPLIEFRGRTYLQTDFEGCASICDQIIQRIEKFDESVVPIGFDLEWTAFCHGTVTQKTALAQLCISPRTCHLFHLYNVPKLPAAFVQLLSHPKVKLVGVNVTGDVRKLARDFPGFPAEKIVENNCVECGTIANEHFNTTTRWGLAKLTAFLLNKSLAKPPKIRTGQWHRLPLSKAQITYASTDAYASLMTYVSIESKSAQQSS